MSSFSKRKYSKTLEGFIAQRKARGISVTPELLEHYADVKYSELPWWKKLFTEDPTQVRDFNKWFIQNLPEYFKERSKL